MSRNYFEHTFYGTTSAYANDITFGKTPSTSFRIVTTSGTVGMGHPVLQHDHAPATHAALQIDAGNINWNGQNMDVCLDCGTVFMRDDTNEDK